MTCPPVETCVWPADAVRTTGQTARAGHRGSEWEHRDPQTRALPSHHPDVSKRPWHPPPANAQWEVGRQHGQAFLQNHFCSPRFKTQTCCDPRSGGRGGFLETAPVCTGLHGSARSLPATPSPHRSLHQKTPSGRVLPGPRPGERRPLPQSRHLLLLCKEAQAHTFLSFLSAAAPKEEWAGWLAGPARPWKDN